MTQLYQKRQRGQAAVYALIITPILFLSLLLVYNVSTLITQKIKLQNTADATTYSAGVIYARNLNFISYTNRAMAANEAGIASLASGQTMAAMVLFSRSNKETTDALKKIMDADKNTVRCARGFAPACSRVEPNLKRARDHRDKAREIANRLDYTQLIFRGMQDFLRLLNYGVSVAQTAVEISNLAQVKTTIDDVMKENDADAYLPAIEGGLGVGVFMAQCMAFTKTYWDVYDNDPDPTARKNTNLEYKDEVLRFGHAAMSVMDLFSKRRQIMPEVFDPRYRGNLRYLPIDWAGGTELVAEKKGDTREYMHWQSADRLNIIPAYQLALGDLSLVTSPDDHAENQLDAYNGLTSVWGMGAGTASGGDDNVNLDSWKGNKLGLPTAFEKSRTYGDIRKFNGSFDDIKDSPLRAELYTDPARGNKFKDFISAAFYRSIIGKDRDLIDLVDGRHPTAVAHQLSVGGLRYRYGNTQKIGILTNNIPMAPFKDVRHHTQTIAYLYDAEVEDGLSYKEPEKEQTTPVDGSAPPPPKPTRISQILESMNLSDIGPALVLSMRKDISKIGYKKLNSSTELSAYESEEGGGTGLLNNRISVISSAEIYFKRPQDYWARKDSPKKDEGNTPLLGFTGGYIEHKNLFSPYWHVRNSQPSLVSKLANLALNLKP